MGAFQAKKGIIMLSLALSMVLEELRILSQNCCFPLFVRQYVEGEAHPEASVIPECVQIKPVLPAAPLPHEVLEPELAEEVEENDDAAVLAPDNGLPPSDAPVAGGPKLKHGSEEYKHLLPDREGGIVALHGVVPIAFLHSKPKLPHELSGREA